MEFKTLPIFHKQFTANSKYFLSDYPVYILYHSEARHLARKKINFVNDETTKTTTSCIKNLIKNFIL